MDKLGVKIVWLKRTLNDVPDLRDTLNSPQIRTIFKLQILLANRRQVSKPLK